MRKPSVTEENSETSLWFPENYHWGPSETEERHTQGGGTVVWDQSQNGYVFKIPPNDPNYKSGDLMPEEWGII